MSYYKVKMSKAKNIFSFFHFKSHIPPKNFNNMYLNTFKNTFPATKDTLGYFNILLYRVEKSAKNHDFWKEKITWSE